MNPAGEPARCAAHPVEPAVATCARCGNFMCEACRSGSPDGLCPRCVALVGAPFPLSRESWNFGALWDLAWARFKLDWLMLSVGVLITFGVSMGVSMVGQVFMAGMSAVFRSEPWAAVVVLVPVQLVGVVVNGGIQMGLVLLALDSMRGQKIDVGRMFIPFRYLGRYVLLLLLMFAMLMPVFAVLGGVAFGPMLLGSHSDHLGALAGLGIAVGTIGMLVAMFFLLLPLTFAVPELVAHPETDAITILKNCFALARENRWSIFGVLLVGGLAVLVGMLACCIGIIPAIALEQLLIVGLYLTLRNGSEIARPAPAPTDFAAG